MSILGVIVNLSYFSRISGWLAAKQVLTPNGREMMLRGDQAGRGSRRGLDWPNVGRWTFAVY